MDDLIRGDTCCFRASCLAPFAGKPRWWCEDIHAFFCTTCAKRMNGVVKEPMCSTEQAYDEQQALRLARSSTYTQQPKAIPK